MVILICLAVPTIMLYTTQEVRRIKREEFMMAATVLGEVIGITYGHTYCHHFFTCRPTICEHFITSFTSWLVGVIFGGTIISGLEADSVTKEWTGLIGQNFRHLTTHTWIVLIPIAFIV